jgi:hypothetical protein
MISSQSKGTSVLSKERQNIYEVEERIIRRLIQSYEKQKARLFKLNFYKLLELTLKEVRIVDVTGLTPIIGVQSLSVIVCCLPVVADRGLVRSTGKRLGLLN